MEFKTKPLPVLAIVTILFFSNLVFVLTCPEKCECKFDEGVTCQHALLDYLPDNINPEVQSLDFSYNIFTSISNDFSDYTNLKKLIFTGNRIESLASGFLTHPGLEYLDLSKNSLVSYNLHPNALRNLPNLTTLNLSYNNLRKFPELQTKIKTLNVDNCSISGINIGSSGSLGSSGGILSSYTKLETLKFTRNNLPTLSDQFRSKTLKTLNLSECQIQTVQVSALNKLPKLQHLYLNKNYQLKSFTGNSSSLITLDLSDCNLESIPGREMPKMERFPNLVDINLSGNHLRRLEDTDRIFDTMPKLQVINLRGNSIDFIGVNFFYGELYLKTLDISQNTFRSLDPNIFKTNINLMHLNLSRTYLDVVIRFNSMSLTSLDLTDCEIRQISWNALQKMPKLEKLRLSGNLINEIPINLTSNSLAHLDISNNRLSSLRNNTFYLTPNLRLLNIMGNRLVQLDFYNSFKGIRVLYLGDNPWRCECTSKSFETLFRTLDQLSSDVEYARCQTPGNLEGRTWAEACGVEWFPWDITQGNKAWMGSVIVMVVFILSCCLFVSLNRECNKRKKRLVEEEHQRRSEAQQRLLTMIAAASEHLDEESRNAPDPREIQGPPSYNEAITMPPLGSTASLYSKDDLPSVNGSVQNLNHSRHNISNGTNNNDVATKQKVKRKKRPKSPYRNRMSAASQESSQVSDANQSSSQMSSYVRSNSHVSDMSKMSASNPDLLDKSGKPLSAKSRRRRRRSETRSQRLGDSSSDELSVIETNM